MRQGRPPRDARGVSLVEACVVIALLSIIAAMAAPSFGSTRHRIELQGVAAQVETDIHFARSEAVSRAEPVHMEFGVGTAGSCYVIHTGAAGDCTCADGPEPACNAGAAPLRTVHLPATGNVRIESNVDTMLFNGVRGTVSPAGTVRIIEREAGALHQVVNAMGRVRTCSPQTSITGVAAC